MKLIAVMTLLTGLAHLQDVPEDIAKKDLPKAALCVICTQAGETELEKPAAGVRYKGQSYYFCNTKEIVAFKKDPEASLPAPVPRPAPAITLKLLSGAGISPATLSGKPILVDFWATWCKPCVETMPHLQKLHNTYSSKGLVVLGISLDEKGEAAVRPFIAKKKFTYPIAMDRAEEPLWQQFRARALPALFLVDQKGTIVRQWVGKPDPKAVEEAVKGLLK